VLLRRGTIREFSKALPLFRLSPTQFEALARQRAQSLRSRGLSILRTHYTEQCHGRTDEQLLAHIEAVAAFALNHHVREPENILLLLRAQMDQRHSANSAGYLAYRLKQAGLDEATRMKNFLAACAQPQVPQVISLATPIGQ